AARMDGDHRHLRADLPAAAETLRHRPDPVGNAGVRESAGRVPVAAGGDVGVLSEGRLAAPCHAEPDLRWHDAVHARRHPLHGHHVPVAGDDAVAAELPLRRLKGAQTGSRALPRERPMLSLDCYAGRRFVARSMPAISLTLRRTLASSSTSDGTSKI